METEGADKSYIEHPDGACVLACDTMVTQYFFPGTAFDEIASVSRWEAGRLVWEMPFWNWLMEKGIYVTNYDPIDYERWSEEGTDGLSAAVAEKEFAYYRGHTTDLDSYTKDVRELLKNERFTHHKKSPTWEDLRWHFNNNGVCTTVLNANVLDGKDGSTLHKIVILDITETHVVFQDPHGKDEIGPTHEETHEHFMHAWAGNEHAPSLCVYTKEV